jgi:hypothetical protein
MAAKTRRRSSEGDIRCEAWSPSGREDDGPNMIGRIRSCAPPVSGDFAEVRRMLGRIAHLCELPGCGTAFGDSAKAGAGATHGEMGK